MTIGTRIRQLRTQNNLSQEALANQLGLSRQAVAKWEHNLSMPSTANLLALCEVFGISLDELLPPEIHQQKNKWYEHRAFKAILLVSSIVMIFISIAAWMQESLVPNDIIGYADAETDIIVAGNTGFAYPVIFFTALLILFTVLVFLKSNWKGRQK